jgi:hypothetical protein
MQSLLARITNLTGFRRDLSFEPRVTRTAASLGLIRFGGYRWFESISLQRGVGCELAPHGFGGLSPTCATVAGVRPDRFSVGTLPNGLAALKSDPWIEMDKLRQSISTKVRRQVGETVRSSHWA